MKAFLARNKIPIAIVSAALIIAAAVLLSNKTPPSPQPPPQSTPLESPSIKISYTQAPDYVGKEVCVIGIVDHVYTSPKGTVFLNFCPDYKTCPFGAVIFQDNVSRFPNIRRYTGKKIEITGFITLYQNRPEIVLDSPTQIKLAQ